MDDELAAIAQEILDYREGLPDENGIDGDIGKYMTFSEEENDVKIEIKNDEILSMTSADDESGRLDFQGFECSFDPNAFENVDQQANEKTHQNINNSVSSYLDEPSNSKSDSNVTKNASNSKQKKKRGRRSKNVDKEEELISDFEESTPQQPESQNGLDEINDCPESPFDDGCLNKSESVGTRRKSTRDSDEKEEELPLKRTRRRINLGDASTTTSTTESELEMGHKILKQLMSFPGSTPFLDRPDMSAHGMTNYYVVVKKPMWLKAVLKRYNEDKYPSITELIADIRLVLENCYLYWGTGDPLTKKALRVEELLEKKLATLPSEVRDLCSLKATHGEDPSEDLSEENKTDETNQYDSETSCQNSKKSVFISRLLQRVVNNSETNSIGSENSVVESVGTDVEEWEKSVLYNGDVENEIASMWELPLIGQFLNLALDILSIGQISQYEVERMLLIPQASTVLARIMTSMLVTPFSRVKLEEGPPMPYEFWTNKLKKKLALWYRTYRGTGDLSPVKVFDLIGIEPEFWLVMGESNPLEEMQFHELKFIQRVWILKTLCDYLLHNHKSFQEKFNNLELDDLRESYLGRDKQGFAYHYFPEFYEVRIYKRAKVPDKRWNDFNDGVDQMIFSAVDDEEDDSFDENEARDGRLRYKLPRSLHPSPKSFKMVAKCVEDVRCLLDVVSKSSAQNGSLLKRNLSAILAQLEPNDSKIENSTALLRKKMHKEWLDYTNRPKDYVDPGASYWSKKELRDKEEKAKEDIADFIENVDNIMTVEKRERRSTRENQKYVFDELEKHLGPEADGEDYEQPDEEDDSEDEWVATPSKKKKKQQNVSQRKIKKLQTLTQKLHNKTDDANRTVETNNIYVRKFPTENSDSSSVPPSSTTNSIRVRKFPTENSDLSFGQSNSTSTNIRVRQFPTESSRLRFGTSSSTNSDQVIVIKDEPDDVDSSNNVQSNCVQPPPPPPQSVPSTHPPPPPVIPLTHYVKQEALKREAGEYNAFQVKSESTVIRRKSTSKSDEVINLLSDDEDEASDVLPVDEDVKPVVKTIECVVNCLVENSQNVVLPPTIQQPSMIQSQFVQKKQISSPQQIQAAPFPQMLPPQPTMIFNQRNNIVQPPPQMAPISFPNNNPSLMQSPPTSINSPPFATVKQEPGTFVPSQQQQQPVAAPMFNSLSPQQQSPRMRGSPQMVRGSPSSRGRMMSQQSPRMMTSPRMMATSPRMMGQQSRSPMLQRGGRMPMPNMGRGSPQNMRQHSPQTFPQRGNMTSPQFGSPQRNNIQARRNLNFNSPSRPQTSNPTPSPSRNNLASNSSDRPKERLHIINSGGVVGKNTKTVEGKLVVAMNDDGSYGYFAVLSDGGKLTVSQKQISELRSKCNGSLPDKVGIPMVITD